MGAEAAFDLAVKLVAGVLVLITFKAKFYQPLKDCLKKKIVQPHVDLNNRCDEFEKTQETRSCSIGNTT